MALDRRLPSSWCRRVGSPKTGTSSPGSMVSPMPATVAEVWMAWTASSARRFRSSSVKATRSPRPAPGSARRSSATRWSCSALRSIVCSMRIWLSVRSDGRVEQELDEAPDGGDRCPQLVRDRGHDVVLHLGQLAEPVVLLDERLRDLLLDGEEALAVGGQLLALGHVDGATTT